MECFICFEIMNENTLVSQCNRCKKYIHIECSNKCFNTCPFCRFKAHDKQLQYGALVTIQQYARKYILKNYTYSSEKIRE